MSKFEGISSDICQIAWLTVLPTIENAARVGLTNKRAGTLVVLDPAHGDILFSASVDEDYPDSEKYDEIAMAKAKLSWRTQMPSRRVQQEAPHLYTEGDTKWGGAVIRNGLVVSFSGVQAVFDEAIAWSVLAWIEAICRYEMVKPDGVMNQEGSYIK